MTAEELKSAVAALIPSGVFEEGGEWLTVQVDPKEWKAFAMQLRNGAGLDFDYLFCVTVRGLENAFHHGVSSHFHAAPPGAGCQMQTGPAGSRRLKRSVISGAPQNFMSVNNMICSEFNS
jgi:hypothetical protein